MANISHSSFLLFFLSFALFLSDCLKKVETAYEFEEKSMTLHHPMHVLAINSLMTENVCSTPAEGSKNLSKLQVAYTYGPCSPLKRGNTTHPSLRQIILQDQIRIKYINSKMSSKDSVSSSTVELPANYDESLVIGEFVVTVGLGTPAQKFIVIFDTGSDLLWVQCLPCSGGCYTQKDPYFDPSSSSTYSNIACGSDACSQVTSATGNIAACTTNCIYQSTYGDGSYSEGNFATDTLTLSSSDVFPNFEFGCGEAYGGNFGHVDGLLGLGRNQISTVSQTAQTYGKLFSYCLPSTTTSTGYLAFGEAVSSSGVQYTPLLTNNAQDSSSFYFLNLMGISVGGELLSISSSVFTTAGTIIDSGTTITYLAPTAYSALRSAFRQAMTNYTLTSSYSIFDTCYDLSGYSSITVPSIVLHFSGDTDLHVDSSGILIEKSSTHYCLAFTGNSADTDLEIIGNTQQKTIEMIYDVARGMLGIVSSSCS